MDTAWPSEAEKDNITCFALDEQRPKITLFTNTNYGSLALFRKIQFKFDPLHGKGETDQAEQCTNVFTVTARSSLQILILTS